MILHLIYKFIIAVFLSHFVLNAQASPANNTDLCGNLLSQNEDPSPQRILENLAPRNFSNWMLNGASIIYNTKTHNHPLESSMAPGSTAKAHMIINRDLDILKGHFPGNPIVPGVTQTKMMAQVANFIINKALSPNQETSKAIRLVKLENFKFKKPILPGMEIEIIATLEDSYEEFYDFSGAIYYNNKVIARGEFTISTRELNKTKGPQTNKKISPSTNIIVEKSEVENFLPHRFPFLFVDGISLLPEEDSPQVGQVVEAKLHITEDMIILDRTEFTQSVVPEDIQVEIMAQASAFFLYKEFKAQPKSTVEVMLTNIARAEFYSPVTAGMNLTIRTRLKSSRHGIMTFESKLYSTHGELLSSANFSAIGQVKLN